MTKKNTPAFKLIEGSAAISEAIDSIARRGKSLDRDIQVAALSAMQHHSEHGDVTLINRLVVSMPKGSRVNALRTFIETFGAVVYDKNKFVHSKSKTFRLDDAMQVLWTDFKPETAYQPITDPAKLVNSLIARLEADVDKLGSQSKVTPYMLDMLREITSTKPAH